MSLFRTDLLPIQAPPRHPSKVPGHQTCWGVIKPHQNPSPTPVLVTSSEHEANNEAGLDQKSTQPNRTLRSVRIKLDAGNEDSVDIPGDENNYKNGEKEADDYDENKNLDQRVMTWLDGLDSATCRRFMRKQMAALQEIDDVD